MALIFCRFWSTKIDKKHVSNMCRRRLVDKASTKGGRHNHHVPVLLQCTCSIVFSVRSFSKVYFKNPVFFVKVVNLFPKLQKRFFTAKPVKSRCELHVRSIISWFYTFSFTCSFCHLYTKISTYADNQYLMHKTSILSLHPSWESL